MKTTYSFLLIIFSILTTSISAQEIDTDNIKLDIREIIPVKDQGFVIFKSDNAAQPFLLEFSFFDVNMQLVSSRKMSIYQAGEVFSVEKIFVWNEKLILHGAHYLPATKKNQLFQYEFSLPDLSLQKENLVLISKAPKDVYVPYYSNLSPDKTKLVLVGWDYNKSKQEAYVRIRIIDQKLKEIRRQTYLFPYENRRFSIDEVLVNNEGEVYITGNHFKGSFLAVPRPSQINHFVVGLFAGEKGKKWDIQKENYAFQTFKYTIAPNGDLVGLGLCIRNDYQGSTYFQINPLTEEIVVNNQSIGKDLFEKAFTKNSKYLNPPDHTFNDYQLQKIIRQADSYYLISEHQDYYAFKDILVLKLDLKGYITWSTRIPKYQDIIFDEAVFSYTFLDQQNKFYFLFNDNIANYEQEGKKKDLTPAIIPEVKLVAAVLDLSTGKLERRPIKDIIDKDYVFLPNLCELYTKEQAVLIGSGFLTKTDSLQMKKIELPE